MPTYVYKFVDTGDTIEVQQGFHDDTLTELAHPDSGEVLPVKKVFTPVGVTFKGSGFFKTDNRGAKKSTAAASTDGAGGSSSDSSGTTSDKTSESSGSSTAASTSSSGSTTNGTAATPATPKTSSPS